MRGASNPSFPRRAAAAALGFVIAASGPAAAFAQDLPPVAQPGQCFGRVRFPDAISVERHRERVRGPRRFRRMSPAVLRWTSTRTLVSAARTESLEIPARYRDVVRFVTTPGPMRWTTTPARYRWIATRALIAPARLAWVPGHGTPQEGGAAPGQTLLTPTGEILCRVRLPARYAVRRQRVLVSPGRRFQVAGPSVRRRVVERVEASPARTVARTLPAVWRTVRHAEIVRPARATWVVAVARWREVATERRVGRNGWAQVVCPAGLAPWAMQRLQTNLSARGYAAGPADGLSHPKTLEALRRFQHDHGLAEGQITVESARVLGVVH